MLVSTGTRHPLRAYQRSAVDRVIVSLPKRPILVAPTGSGKTLMATALVEELGLPTLWLAHRKELVEQAAHRLEAHGLCVGVILAGCTAMPLAKVQVASVQTLVRRELPHAQLIVIDEAHHATAATHQKILDAYPHAHRVGLTATPFRLDGRGLGDLFGELIIAATTKQLCDEGVLHAPKVWCSKSPDLRGVRVIAGDYSLEALSRRTNTAELNADIVQTWLNHAAGIRTVAFAVDIEHSRAIATAFQTAGAPAEHLDGATPRDERDAILARLAAGKTQIVSNCMVLTEGWDLPALQCAIVARPTASLNLHLQMIGRVMRAADGKSGAIVLDHAGNHHVHGLVTRSLSYSLDGNTRVGHDEPLGIRETQNSALSGHDRWGNYFTREKLLGELSNPSQNLLSAVDEMREKLIGSLDLPTTPRRKVRRGLDWGDELDADRYLDREPNCWERSIREAQPRRTITIGCNITVASSVKPDQLLYRGAAALALADILAQRGCNVGIVLFKSVEHPTNTVEWGVIRYTIKDPLMPLDVPAVALAMCEIAFSRIVGVCGEARHWPGSLRSGFGTPAPVPAADREGIDYLIDADCLSRESAEIWLRSQVRESEVCHV